MFGVGMSLQPLEADVGVTEIVGQQDHDVGLGSFGRQTQAGQPESPNGEPRPPRRRTGIRFIVLCSPIVLDGRKVAVHSVKSFFPEVHGTG